ELGVVAGEESERQVAGDAELLVEAPARRGDGALARTRMPAARIRPQPARVIFLRIALLQPDPPAIVNDEDRERPVKPPGTMHRGLAGLARGGVAFVDQDEVLFARHGLSACRRSRTRTALPCERGTSPGALSTTVQVTPTIVLMWSRTSCASLATNGSSGGAGAAGPASRGVASIRPPRAAPIR